MFIYLDESGDLGFDFKNKNPSNHFTITLLICDTQETAAIIKKAAERTLKNKVRSKKKSQHINELKGSNIPFKVKHYFFEQIQHCSSWDICSIIFDKKSLLSNFPRPIDIHRLYNMLAHYLLRQVNFSNAKTVHLFVDKSKNRAGIIEFDTMLKTSLCTTLPFNVPLNITHICSQKNFGIQAVDLFCWGMFRKYEINDELWYDMFKRRIIFEQKFLVHKKKTAPLETLLL